MRYTEAMSADGVVVDPDPIIEAFKKEVDRTLLRENLKLSVEERLRQLMELQGFAKELQEAGRALRRKP